MTDDMTVNVTSDVDVVITRTFDAPRELVFKAYSDPALIPNWWGPRNTKTVVDKMEFLPGGKYRYRNIDETGREDGFRGEYIEIIEPELIISTFEWEGMPGHISTDKLEFIDENGKTKVIDSSHFQSKEDLDGMMQTGMETGMRETWDRLAEQLETMK